MNRARDIDGEFVSTAVQDRDAARVDASLGGEEGLKTLVVAVVVAHRNDGVRRPPQGVGSDPAEQPFGAGVPPGDDAAGILFDQRIDIVLIHRGTPGQWVLSK